MPKNIKNNEPQPSSARQSVCFMIVSTFTFLARSRILSRVCNTTLFGWGWQTPRYFIALLTEERKNTLVNVAI